MMRVYESRNRAEAARRQLAATATELQERLRPGTIASHAWEEVKDKGGELADDAVGAVKARPVAAASVLAAFALFLARQPIRSAVSKILSKAPDGTKNGKIDRTARAAVHAER
ncbi:MAG TPA: DUF3618 domain-containing protein [Allosphingosinicella sp.]|nr:DUF3618 domain-containing protein [Allosphingosinicella sp.]